MKGYKAFNKGLICRGKQYAENIINANNDNSSGDSAKIGSSGYSANVNSTGKNAVIMCAGNKSKAKGKIGSWITLTEWELVNNEYMPICVKTEKIDGVNIKEDTYYMLKNGVFVEVE